MKKRKSYDIDPDFGAPPRVETPEEAATRQEQVKEERKQSRLAKASFAWTVISMVYAIVSGAVLISGNWILSPYSYIMAGLLGVYVVLFVVLVACYTDDVKKGKKKIKVFKKLFGMFRVFTTLVFLVATAVSMAGVVDARGAGLAEWLVLGANILVAAVQLSLKISLFVFGIVAKQVGRHYTVKVQTYVNGVVTEHKAKSAVMSKVYGTEVTKSAPAVQSSGNGARKKDAAKSGEEEAKRLKLDKETVRALAAEAADRISVKAKLPAKKKGAAAETVPADAPSSPEGTDGE